MLSPGRSRAFLGQQMKPGVALPTGGVGKAVQDAGGCHACRQLDLLELPPDLPRTLILARSSAKLKFPIIQT